MLPKIAVPTTESNIWADPDRACRGRTDLDWTARSASALCAVVCAGCPVVDGCLAAALRTHARERGREAGTFAGTYGGIWFSPGRTPARTAAGDLW